MLPLPKDDYLAAHIPGAVFFDVDAVSDRSIPLPHMFPSAEQFGRGLFDRDQKVRGDAGCRVVDHAIVFRDLEGPHTGNCGDLAGNFKCVSVRPRDRRGTTREIGLSVGNGLERMDREGPFRAGAVQHVQSGRTTGVTDQVRRLAGIADRLGEDADLRVGNTEQHGAAGQGFQSVRAAAQLDLATGSEHRGGDRLTDPAGADDHWRMLRCV